MYHTAGPHDLGIYHNDTVNALGANEERHNFDEEQGVHYDTCTELSMDLLVEAGLGPDDTDDGGAQVTDDVQTLLTLAMFRAPALREFFERVMADAANLHERATRPVERDPSQTDEEFIESITSLLLGDPWNLRPRVPNTVTKKVANVAPPKSGSVFRDQPDNN